MKMRGLMVMWALVGGLAQAQGRADPIDLVCTDYDRSSALKNASSTVSVQLRSISASRQCIVISGTTPGGFQFESNFCTDNDGFKAVWSDRTIRATYGSSSTGNSESWLLDRVAGTLSGTGAISSKDDRSKFQYRDLQCAKVDKPKF